MKKSAWLIAIITAITLFILGDTMSLSFVQMETNPLKALLSNRNTPIPVATESQLPLNAHVEKDEPEAQQLVGQIADPDVIDPLPRDPTLMLLYDFKGDEPEWYSIDDNVMGGISQSRAIVNVESELLTFAGIVSLENNGGFSSVRSQWTSYDLGSSDGIVLRVRGDGKVYRLRIWSEETGREVAYTAVFATEADRWTEVYIDYSTMVPLYRGFVVNRAGALNPEAIRSVGLMIADKQEGTFTLEVDWIKARISAPNAQALLPTQAENGQ